MPAVYRESLIDAPTTTLPLAAARVIVARRGQIDHKIDHKGVSDAFCGLWASLPPICRGLPLAISVGLGVTLVLALAYLALLVFD